jgi:hypothetical protein
MTGLRTATVAAAAAAALLTASVALADVAIEHRLSVEGTGLMSAGNMSGTTWTTISGDRSRTDSDIQLQSHVARLLAHRAVGPTAEIIRLDEGKIERLDVTRRQYTEITFEDMKARLRKEIDKAQGGRESQEPMDDSKCEWLDPKVDVRRSGEKATYAGFEGERFTIIASQPCTDRQTGATCEVALGLDEWLAPKFTASAEADRFHHAYAQKIGLDLTSGRGGYGGGGDISDRARSIFGRYSGIWREIASKARDAEGYPVKMSFAFGIGGARCKNASPLPDPGRPQPASPASILPGGLVPIVTLSSEVLSVSTASVSPAVFEVPSDFKKLERQSD